jgi:hypothetical protein
MELNLPSLIKVSILHLVFKTISLSLGPSLKFGIYLSSLVEDSKGGVILVGGVSRTGILNTLFHLTNPGKSALIGKILFDRNI